MPSCLLLPRGALAAWLIGAAAGAAIAQQPAASPVRSASFRQTAPRSIRFARRPPQIGDQIEQSLALELRLGTTVRQGDQLTDETASAMRREQRRLVTTSEVQGDRATAVRVRYVSAHTKTASGRHKSDLDDLPMATARQPVEGKVYDCRRDGEQLVITDSEGNIPPLEEFRIVSESMEALGRPNPLAEFLVGRTVTVGGQVEVPRDVAERLLGLGDQLGQVTRFVLTLDDVRSLDGTPCAVFNASIEAASSDSSQMRMQLTGPLVIQVATCRAVQADFLGPIGMVETRGSLNHTCQIAATGRMVVRIASTYRDVQR